MSVDESTISTLEKIALEDNVDDKFRKRFVRGEFIYYMVTTLGFGALSGFSLESALDEVTVWNVAGTTLGGILAGIGAKESLNFLNIAKEYKRSGYTETYENKFYLLGNKISTHRTVVEERLGQIIIPVSSLDSFNKMEEPITPLYFIDDLEVGEPEIKSDSWEENEFDGQYYIRVRKTMYESKLELKRGDETTTLTYTGEENPEKRFKDLIKHKGEKIAVLFKAPSVDKNNKYRKLSIVCCYDMNKLLV
jgi:hypothetical protein